MKNFLKPIAIMFFASITLLLSWCNQGRSLLINVFETWTVVKNATLEEDSSKENQVVCKKFFEFKNERWANNLDIQYDNFFDNFIQVQDDVVKSLRSRVEIADRDACLIWDYFIFFPPISEFACERILSYDISKDVLAESLFGAEQWVCASKFGEITDSYVEYFWIMADAILNVEFEGKYFYKSNTQELTRKERVFDKWSEHLNTER